MKDRILELGLPHGSFMVVGSGIMNALGIRESDDIDMIVTDEVFEKLQAEGWERADWVDQVALKHGPFDVGATWGGKTIDELLPRAVTIDGIPYLSLTDLRAWKHERGREKDLHDVELIDQYLAKNV